MDTRYGVDDSGCFELEWLETGVLWCELLKLSFIFGVFDEEHDLFEIALEFVKFFILYLGRWEEIDPVIGDQRKGSRGPGQRAFRGGSWERSRYRSRSIRLWLWQGWADHSCRSRWDILRMWRAIVLLLCGTWRNFLPALRILMHHRPCFLTGKKTDIRIPLCYMLMNAIALHLRYIVLFRLVLNPQEKINSWIIVHNIKRFEFVPEFLDGNLWSAGSVGDSESCGIQWMKSVRAYDVFSFVQHMVEHIRKNAVVSHVIFGDGILCTHRFHHLRSCYVIRVILSSDPFSG